MIELLRMRSGVRLARGEWNAFRLVSLNVVSLHLLARPMDRCGKRAADGTGVLTCFIFGLVLPDRKETSVLVLLPLSSRLPCSLYGLWPVPIMITMFVLVSE